MSYRIMPDVPFVNNEGKCNNNSCPKPTIYWNNAVLNKETGKKMPLNEPFTGQRTPQPHRCMRANPPAQYIRKSYGDPIIDSINYSQELYDFLKKSRWSYQTLK
jgi:hypothetical protein